MTAQVEIAALQKKCYQMLTVNCSNLGELVARCRIALLAFRDILFTVIGVFCCMS